MKSTSFLVEKFTILLIIVIEKSAALLIFRLFIGKSEIRPLENRVDIDLGGGKFVIRFPDQFFDLILWTLVEDSAVQFQFIEVWCAVCCDSKHFRFAIPGGLDSLDKFISGK